MNETITLAVPPMLAAVYLVPSDLSPPAARQIAGRDVVGLFEEPLQELVSWFLEGPLLTIETRESAQLPPPPLPLLRHMGATPDELELLTRAERFVLVQVTDQAGWPPAHEWVARAVAAAIAAEEDRPVADTFLPKLLSADEAIASLPDADGQMQLSRWVSVPQSAGPLGLWTTTRGLGRFGLPELQTTNVPPQIARAWSRVLTGVGAVLFETWSEQARDPDPPAFVQIPERLSVGAQDVARAYDSEPIDGGTAEVKLVFDPATDDRRDSFLTVQPPDEFPASAGEFMVAVSETLFGSSDSEVRRVPTTEAMQAAMQTARELLPAARQRLIAGELELRARLMIKYEIPNDGSSEYVWMSVTSWPDPGTVLGSWANDAESDPTVRTGRPATVHASRIVDWGIWVDGEGFTEGAWTNRLLEQPE